MNLAVDQGRTDRVDVNRCVGLYLARQAVEIIRVGTIGRGRANIDVTRGCDRTVQTNLARGQQVDIDVVTRLDGNLSGALLVKARTARDCTARAQVEVVLGVERDGAAGLTSSHHRTLKHHDAAAGAGNVDLGIKTASLETRGDDDGARSPHLDQGIITIGDQGTAHVGRQAIGLESVAHQHIRTSAVCHCDVEHGVGNQSASDDHLLIDVEIDFPRNDACIGRAEGVVDVGGHDLDQTPIEVHVGVGTHVAHDVDAACMEMRGVLEDGIEFIGCAVDVLDVADQHKPDFLVEICLTTNVDTVEPGGQGFEILHRQIEEAVVRAQGEVVAIHRLACTADAVVLQ